MPCERGHFRLVDEAQKTTGGISPHRASWVCSLTQKCEAPAGGGKMRLLPTGRGPVTPTGSRRSTAGRQKEPAPLTTVPSPPPPGTFSLGGRALRRCGGHAPAAATVNGSFCPRLPTAPARPALTAPGRPRRRRGAAGQPRPGGRAGRRGGGAAAAAGLPAAPRSSRTQPAGSRDGERWLAPRLSRRRPVPVAAEASPRGGGRRPAPWLSGQPGGATGHLPASSQAGSGGGGRSGRERGGSGRRRRREGAGQPRAVPGRNPRGQGPGRLGVSPAALPTAARLLLRLYKSAA